MSAFKAGLKCVNSKNSIECIVETVNYVFDINLFDCAGVFVMVN